MRKTQNKTASFQGLVILGLLLTAAAQVAAGEGLVPKLFQQFEQAAQKERYVEASLIGESSLWLADRVFGGQPDSQTERSMELLAESYINQKHYANAQRVYEQLLLKRSQESGPEHPTVAKILWRLGDIQAMQGSAQAAALMYENALTIEKKTLSKTDILLTEHMLYLGNFYASVGKPEDAEKYYLHALSVRSSVFGEQDPSVANAMLVLAEFYRSQDEMDKAEQFYKVALSAQGLNADTKEGSAGIISILLARFYDKRGDAERSQQFYSRGAVTLAKSYGVSAKGLPSLDSSAPLEAESTDIVEKALEQMTPLQVAEALKNEAEAYVQLNVPNRARRAIEQSVQAYERLLEPTDPRLGEIILEHAQMLERLGDNYGAEQLERRAAQIPRR